jgi:pimeloyl-ACP methyl ester carboxylesterase
MDSPDQGASGIPLRLIAARDRALTFDVPSIGGAYRGAWDEAQARWTGEWTQGSTRLALNLARSGETPQGPFTGLGGDWDALLEAGSTRLRLVLHIRVAEAGTVTSLDSLDQGATGIPVSTVRRDGTTVTIESKRIAAQFVGTLGADGRTIAGRWAQAGQFFPLTFARRAEGTSAPEMRRPQTPAKPYPYREQDVAYENTATNVRLAGSLTIPPGAGPFPAVLLIAGSGPLDRDETLFGHKPFLVLADHLTRRGIAVLRVDKRGIGKSTGDHAKATTADFASDVEAGVQFLKSRPEVDARKISLVGHSEGGLIAPLVATRNPAVTSIVLLAGPGVRGDQLIVTQIVDDAKAAGWTEARLTPYEALLRNLFAAITSAPNASEAAARARDVMQAARDVHGLSDDEMTTEIQSWTSDWFRFFLSYDPVPALRQVKGPVLAINGSKDLQVAAKPNLAAIRSALAENRDVEVSELPGLNHLFQTAKTGRTVEYGVIEETFAPAALDLISNWIAARAR